MPIYLIQLSIGPIQGFIATARRSRDLWFGSWVMSEISKAAASSLTGNAGKLIFPHPDNDNDLAPKSDLLVGNVILAMAECQDLKAVGEMVNKAKAASQKRWDDFCQQAWDEVARAARDLQSGSDQFLDRSVWDQQRTDVLECYAAAVPMEIRDSQGYATALNRLRDLAAQRKNTRDFEPYADHSMGLQKSSLDGARSTVLRSVHEGDAQHETCQRIRQRLGIEPAEQLDLPGLVKRVAGRERGFVPVARIAVDAWLESLDKADLDSLGKAYAPLVDLGSATRLAGRYAEYDWIKLFPFDAQLLYLNRIDAEKDRLPSGAPESRRRQTTNPYAALKKHLKTLQGKHGAPCPYYALLQADGDKMGMLIDEATRNNDTDGIEAHRQITQALAKFADEVPGTMGEHRGMCIYSGGDDVLGMVRLDKALACAHALQKLFKETMDQVVQELTLDVTRIKPSLSVGLAIVHMLEPLGDVRELAMQAERLAKNGFDATPAAEQRNALGIIIKPRSGSPYVARIPWDDLQGMQQLQQSMRYFTSEAIPAGLPYELRDLENWVSSLFDPAAGQTNADAFGDLWDGEIRVLLGKKRMPNGLSLKQDVRDALSEMLTKGLNESETVERRIQHMLVARWLSGRISEMERA